MVQILGFIYALLAAITWGLIYALDEKILIKTSPLIFMFVNCLVGTILLLPFILFDPQPIKSLIHSDKTTLTLVLLSTVLGVCASIFIFCAIQKLGASTASIFEICYPFFVMFFCYLLFQTNLNFYFFVGSVMMFLGSFVIIKFS